MNHPEAVEERSAAATWSASGTNRLAGSIAELAQAIEDIDQAVYLLSDGLETRFAVGGKAQWNGSTPGAQPLKGMVPPCPLGSLGDATFRRDHGLRYAYVSGGMANGIGSCEIVEALAKEGMLGIFGAAGLPLPRIESAIDRITQSVGNLPFGFNLIHNPAEPAAEAAVADLYIRRGVRLAEASAYLDLTLPVVRYRVHGIHVDPSGHIVTPNRLIAKVSRVEVASKFLAPPPDKFIQKLLASGELTEQQALLSQKIPMAQDVTAEADSGGHTDNRPAITLIPTMIALRDRLRAKHGFAQPLRIGAAGGIATPASAAAAFAMGAAYVLVGSINQSCIESGTSDAVREMLSQAQQADVTMAPAADMFEMGVKVQVLKRGTMFAMRAAKLFEIYRAYPSIEGIPAEERSAIEKNYFRASLDEIWQQTRSFFEGRDPSQIARAEKDPKHKMALVFRWYLGHASRWANTGEPTRKIDYQVWCGPAMGAFNEWVQGSCLEPFSQRSVVLVALNLLYGAAVLTRWQSLRCQGVAIPSEVASAHPLSLADLRARLHPERTSA